MKRTLAATAALLTFTACGGAPQSAGTVDLPAATQPPASPAQVPTASTPAAPTAHASGAAVVPGYAPGQFPSVPSIVIPNLSVLDEVTAKAAETLTDKLKSIPGLKVSPAHCGPEGQPLVGGSVVLGGDGTGAVSGDGITQVRTGDGAGLYSDPETSLVNHGDGSGLLSRGPISLVIHTDGSGTYNGPGLSIVLDGKGGGTMTRAADSVVIHNDGSGTYSASTPEVSLTINADGSGSYSGPGISIINDGSGTALVNGVPVKADRLPPVPPAGKFPPLMKLAPVDPVCGLYVTLEAEILFDYDKSDIRPDAKATLHQLVEPLNGLPQGVSLQVQGHTDAHGSDGYNQGLSERRANAVKDELSGAGVTAPLTATGFGETRPVAPNEIDGKDNPAGRQLNRRVEIFIPTR
ncbi:MAG: OmpA family protein [Propionibacteriaceae bacterium]|nr:OmpA family protein [Propionibacteriaceae bacterium]